MDDIVCRYATGDFCAIRAGCGCIVPVGDWRGAPMGAQVAILATVERHRNERHSATGIPTHWPFDGKP